MNIIVTEDFGGITYSDFYKLNSTNANLIINTCFDILYGIYVLNDKMKITHNNIDFNIIKYWEGYIK